MHLGVVTRVWLIILTSKESSWFNKHSATPPHPHPPPRSPPHTTDALPLLMEEHLFCNELKKRHPLVISVTSQATDEYKDALSMPVWTYVIIFCCYLLLHDVIVVVKMLSLEFKDTKH